MPSPSSLHLQLRLLPGSAEDSLGLVYTRDQENDKGKAKAATTGTSNAELEL